MIKTEHIPTLLAGDPESKREEIRRYFHDSCRKYESLFSLLKSDESFYNRPEPLRHPHIFYYGHTAAFYINKLILAKLIEKRVDPKLESIFAVGVDEMSWDDLDETGYHWPSVEKVRSYRAEVRKLVDGLIDSMSLELPITWESPWWVILMGIEHERIHIETSSVLIRQTDLSLLSPPKSWKIHPSGSDAPRNSLIEVPGGRVAIGKKRDDDYYGWDNEYGYHEADIPDFRASKYIVSNAEFLDFVKSGGYENDSWWEEEGLAWRNYKKAKHPCFWIPDNGNFRYRALAEVIQMPMDWPVEVNYHEAKAFCNWLGNKNDTRLRLPTEDEWYRLYDYCDIPEIVQQKGKRGANIGLRFFTSSPVDMFKHGDFYDIVGNVWQWTETPIYPFEGFEVHPIYDDFTTPTYDGRHNLIKGGSFASTGNETLKSSRYAFRRHFFQHVGFRYVESCYEERVGSSSYESDEQISRYCEFGWGETYFNIPNYSQNCARTALEFCKNRRRLKALDIGCATGRSTLELATQFESVTGLDFSARFIGAAEKIRSEGEISYMIPTEGDLTEQKKIDLPDYLKKVVERVDFQQGDACNLKPSFKEYDLVTAFNLIDRLYDPEKFLCDITERINRDGILVLSSPYTWQEEYTPKKKWLGGFRRNNGAVTTMERLKKVLEPEFRLMETCDMEFVIRETSRKFQHSLAQLSVWEKL